MKKRRGRISFTVLTLSARQRSRPARIKPARLVRGNLAPVNLAPGKKMPSQERQPLKSRIPVVCVENHAPVDVSSAQFALCGAICHAPSYPKKS